MHMAFIFDVPVYFVGNKKRGTTPIQSPAVGVTKALPLFTEAEYALEWGNESMPEGFVYEIATWGDVAKLLEQTKQLPGAEDLTHVAFDPTTKKRHGAKRTFLEPIDEVIEYCRSNLGDS
jgi:hypothetical protein